MSKKGGFGVGSKGYEINKSARKHRPPKRTGPIAADAASSESEEESSGSEVEVEREKKEVKPQSATEGLIDVQNPNRQKPVNLKASEVDVTTEAKLSRREREEVEKQRAKEKYLELHRAGKTDEAKADLARLALIRKEREEAAKKRAEEQQAKEAAKAAARKR
eukprot:TRINITY_DN22831_c0_g1_i1.p1 TRINITY_DN22831_c0_g1~~TRINITY_DN22831_c0_g1_i1.p1  ORF type:complete len:163 (+),score=60.78 TRINITY_DN22831_c0_g1_i1:32-520(+)